MSIAAWISSNNGLVTLAMGALALASALGLATVTLELRRLRRVRTGARLAAAQYPVRQLSDSARMLRDLVEGDDGLKRLARAGWLQDGTLAQRIKEVRALRIDGLPSARAIEAAYEAREAATRLMVWLERLGRNPTEARTHIQSIAKALSDAAGGLQRELLDLEGRKPKHRRRPGGYVKAG